MRLIDADYLKKIIGCEGAEKRGWKTAAECERSLSTRLLYEINWYIDDAPTIDATPVRHARWEDGRCTACGVLGITFKSPTNTEMRVETPWCPACGAKMDGGETP